VSQFGDALARLGFVLVVWEQTRSPLLTAVMAGAEAAPYIVFGPVGGLLADRLPRLAAMLGLDVARCAIQVGVCVAVLADAAPLMLLVLASLTVQLAGCVFNPAQRALAPDLVAPERLVAANGLLSLGESAAPLLAPVFAAALLIAIGPAGFFAVDAITYAISVVCLLRVRPHERVAPGSSHDAPATLGRFAASLRAAPRLRALLAMTFGAVLFSTWARQIGLLVLADARAQDGAALFTILMAVHAGAGVLAGLALPVLAHRLTLRHYLAGGIVWAAGILACAAPLGIVGLLSAVVLQGVGVAVTAAARSFLLQTELPAHARGQGFAAAASLLYAADLASLAAFGALATVLAPEALMLAAGTAMLAALTLLASTAQPNPKPQRTLLPATSSGVPRRNRGGQ